MALGPGVCVCVLLVVFSICGFQKLEQSPPRSRSIHLHVGTYILQIDLADWDGEKRFAQYQNFRIADEKKNYQLSFGEYNGTAGDSLSGGFHPEVRWWADHLGMAFSTQDRDNDRYVEGHCAKEDKGGWWFNRCHATNLNGKYYPGGVYSSRTDDGIVWYTWHGFWYSLRFSRMKIRPESFLQIISR